MESSEDLLKSSVELIGVKLFRVELSPNHLAPALNLKHPRQDQLTTLLLWQKLPKQQSKLQLRISFLLLIIDLMFSK